MSGQAVRVEESGSSLAVRPGVRLLAGILLAVLAADFVWLGLWASKASVSNSAYLAIHSLVSVILTFASAYLLSLSPVLGQFYQAQRRSTELNRLKQELEQHLGETGAELTSTKAKLQSEIALRQQAEEHDRELGQTLERRVSQRTEGLEGTVRGLETELAESKASAETLRKSEKQYRRLLDIANEGIWTIDAQGKTNFMNQHGAELLGYGVPEILNRPPEDFVVAEDLPKALSGGDPQPGRDAQQVEFRMRRRDGSEFWVRSSVSLILGEHREYLGALIFFADCTARQRAEDNLGGPAALFECGQDAIATCDASLHILSWSKGAARLYGWTAEEVVGRAAFELLSNKPDPSDCEKVRQALQQKGQWRGELSQVTKDGRTLMVDVRLNLTPASLGRFSSVVLVATDMTQRHWQETQVLREQRLEAARAVASGLAQELNNALAPILLSAQMLSTKQLDPDAKELLTTLETSAERSADLLKQTLVFARGLEGERVVIQPARLINDMTEITREMLPRNIQVHSEVPSELWTLRGDPAQLQQALLKLCVNAREAMPAGGTLWLRAKNLCIEEESVSRAPGRQPGSYVLLEVQNTGPGIPATLQDRVFEPFFGNQCGLGTGLSLSIVLGIVRSHGGTIELQSRPAAGTTFSMLFPAFPEPTKSTSQAIPDVPPGQGELILVQDEPALRDVAKTTLRKHGYQVLTADDKTQALSLLAQHRGKVRLVLTNINTPSPDGSCLAPAAHRTDPNLRIIAASTLGSGLVQADKLQALRGLGIGRVLAKPYTADELLRAVYDELRSPTPIHP